MPDYSRKTFKSFQEKLEVNKNLNDAGFVTNHIPSGINSKFWIYTDGTIVNLNTLWHYQHILGNINKLKKYGIKQSELIFTDEQSVRLYALSKGFTRMNYSINGGSLVIEAPSNNWASKLKGVIYDFVFDNLKQIDQLVIRVLDSQGRPIKQGGFNWINSTRDQKMQEFEQIIENVRDVNSSDTLITESSLSRLYSHNVDHVCGAISAFRKDFTRKENDQRNKSLRAKLLSKGYSVTQLVGKYPEGGETVSETSYFVVDIRDSGKLFNDLKRLGEEFNQDSVLIIPRGAIANKSNAYLYGTNHEPSNWLGYDNSMPFDVGKLGHENPIYTSYIHGRPFMFESVGIEYDTPKSGFGFWSLKVDARKNWKELRV